MLYFYFKIWGIDKWLDKIPWFNLKNLQSNYLIYIATNIYFEINNK